MFGNLPLVILEAPSGKFIYVGSIPVVLGEMVKASTAAVMGCRAFRAESGPLAGEIVEWKFPAFDTEGEAIDFAASKGCKVVQGADCRML